MKLTVPKCPECGEPAAGTVDTIPGVATFSSDPTEGDVDYSGQTDVDWNNQRTITEDFGDGVNRYLVTCGTHNWFTEIEGMDE